MSRYRIRYRDGVQERVRGFDSKAEAFRWFNDECPAAEATFEETRADGTTGKPKILRRRRRERDS
ncbi:MAG: hypothetical protein H0Z37_04050 [Firmicutes bacterium]|nr:hypothetical protein [Bacillota bacterium]